MPTPSYGPLEEADHEPLAEILGSSYAFPPEDVPEWFERAGKDNVRVLREGATPVAGLFQIPMGQYFAGASVPMIGIAGVGVALERRGANVAKTMMQACVQEIASRGVALSTLFASTQTLYRGVGYERAGKSSEYSIPIVGMETVVSADGLEPRRLGPDDAPRVERLHNGFACEIHGQLDRGPYIWSRVYAPRGRKVRGYGFFAGDELEAYIYFSQRSEPSSMLHDLWATDLCSRTARGYAAIFRFVSAQRSVAEHLQFYQVPSVPFLSLLKESRYHEEAEADWMLRVCDVRAALETRGYATLHRATVTLRLRDELVAANDGDWTLSLEDGRPRVERGGAGDAAMDIRTFAQLYAGYASAAVLARLGRIEASTATCKVLDAIFAGPIPAMSNRF